MLVLPEPGSPETKNTFLSELLIASIKSEQNCFLLSKKGVGGANLCCASHISSSVTKAWYASSIRTGLLSHNVVVHLRKAKTSFPNNSVATPVLQEKDFSNLTISSFSRLIKSGWLVLIFKALTNDTAFSISVVFIEA